MTAYDQARQLGHRVFYEPATETIRQCPENYCLAVRRDGMWIPGCGIYDGPDKGSTINAHSLGIVMDQVYQRRGIVSGETVARAVEEGFFGERRTA